MFIGIRAEVKSEFKGGSTRTLYDQIYDEAAAQGVLYVDAPSGLAAEAEFFSSAHDTLKMDIIEAKLAEYM